MLIEFVDGMGRNRKAWILPQAPQTKIPGFSQAELCKPKLMKIMKTILILLSAVLLSGCFAFDEDKIDPALQKHVDSFFMEADLRGVNIKNRSKLRVRFGNVKKGQGQANMFTHVITIDQNSWGYKINPEGLVFHELGHLFLNRNHDNSMIGDQPKSIMSSDKDPNWIFGGLEIRRKYYVDELFNPETKRPDWSY